MNIKWLCAIVGTMLILAIPQGLWPYSYYEILRWTVFLSSLYNIYQFHEQKIYIGIVIFGITAFLFNPIFPLYLAKSSWIVIDIVSSIFFFLVASKSKANKNNNHYE